MPRISFDPVEGLLHLQSELDRFFGKPLYNFGLTGSNVFPLINVFTDKDGLAVRAEVPGIKPDQIKVSVEAGLLTIGGERPQAAGKGSYHRRERQFGTFSRSIQLPRDLDTEQATAECRNGVLTIRIPRQAAAKPRSIAVRSS